MSSSFTSPPHTRSGVRYGHPLTSRSFTMSLPNASPPPIPSSCPQVPSKDGIPLWSGNDPNYSIFTFLRRVKDALAPFTLSSKDKVLFLRACMNCDTLTPAGAVLEDDFYSTCTDFESFCSNLIKEFACAYDDPCLASLTNFTELLFSNSGHCPLESLRVYLEDSAQN